MRNAVEDVKRRGKRITSIFGWRSGGSSGNTTYQEGMHRGVDIGGYALGESFISPFDGVVTAVRTSGMGTWGNTVCILIDGTDGTRTMLTAHHERIHVREGQRISKGDRIAVVGGTTHTGVTYARHVHLEIQTNSGNRPWRGQPIDPASFWVQQGKHEPSDRFVAGDRIENRTNARINIRKGPGIVSNLTGAQVAPGETVRVADAKGNGIKAGDHHWWNIGDKDTGDGWIAESYFSLVTSPDPEPVTPPEEGNERLPLNPRPFEDLTDKLSKLTERLNSMFDS